MKCGHPCCHPVIRVGWSPQGQHQLSLLSAFLYGNARADVHTLSLLGGEDYSHSPDEETQVWRVEVTNPGSQAGARIRTQIFLGRLAEVLQLWAHSYKVSK